MRVGAGIFQQFLQGGGSATAAKPTVADPAADRLATLAPGTIQVEQQELRGVRESQLNVSTALSFVGAAQSHLASIQGRLHTMKNLAQTATDESLAADYRQTLQNQAGQTVSELEAIASTTRHNGRKLFDGSFNNVVLQTGTAVNERATLSLPSMRPSVLGARAILNSAQGVDDQPLAAGEARINGVAVPASHDASAPAKAEAVNRITAQTSVVARVEATTLQGQGMIQPAYLDGSSNALTINAVNIGGVVVTGGDANGALRNAINRQSELNGVQGSVDRLGRLSLTAQDGQTIRIRATGTAARDLGLPLNVLGEASASGQVALSGPAAFTLSDAAGRLGTPTMLQTVALDLTTSIEFTNLTDVPGAQDALTSVQTALTRVDKAHERLQGLEHQLTVFNGSLARQGESIGGVAELKIERADDALETARQMQAQILLDGAISFQAQANVTPRRALELLRS